MSVKKRGKAGAKSRQQRKQRSQRVGNRKSTRESIISKIKNTKIKDKILLDIPLYAQTEDFTSSAACAMMALKYLNKNFKLKKEIEYGIWQEAVNGSVWYGSKYGLAYALAKRGADVSIMSNTKDEGYETKMAVYENVNLKTLSASFNEIRQKAQDIGIEEEHTVAFSINHIKKALSAGHIPIVLIDAKSVNSYLKEDESMPQWVVVKGYDNDNFYINDPYSYSTITLATDAFRSALGFDGDYHMIVINSKGKR